MATPESTTEPSPYPPLALEINHSCGNRHTILNNAITTSMPRCLPPESTDTHLYAAGLRAFGTIYLTFEKSWDEYVALAASSSSHHHEHAKKMHAFLSNVRPAGIARTPRLLKDLEYLSAPGEADTLSRHRELAAERRFRKHIQKAVHRKPHVLYAYAWCMYMAVFAGGRYIREYLAEVGEDFWEHHGVSSSRRDDDDDEPKPEPAPLERLGYSFLSFDAEDDGNAIKDEFKARLAGAEDVYTESEREDVVQEAKVLYDLTIDLVRDMAKHITVAPAEREDSLPPAYEAESPGERDALLPSYFESFDVEKGFGNADDMLDLRATDEEHLAWRDEDNIRRGPLFWLKLILLVAFMMFVMLGAVFGVHMWAKQAAERDSQLLATRPCGSWFF